MTDLLTTRQVQDLLKVDRITVYRMLQDGRLKGIKIGQQWRFPRAEVERFLGVSPAATAQPAISDPAFPTHCVQTIQDLFAEEPSAPAAEPGEAQHSEKGTQGDDETPFENFFGG